MSSHKPKLSQPYTVDDLLSERLQLITVSEKSIQAPVSPPVSKSAYELALQERSMRLERRRLH